MGMVFMKNHETWRFNGFFPSNIMIKLIKLLTMINNGELTIKNWQLSKTNGGLIIY